MVVQADSTLVAIRKKVRRLTASASESALSTDDIDQYINTYYNSDFPYGIKIDQMRSVYTFYTRPYIDQYPVDVNYIQGLRSPVYVEGIQGYLYKDRNQFYNLWPRWPTKFNPIYGDGTTRVYSFTVPGPFLRNEVVMGGVNASGVAISINDDGNGNLLLETPNAQTLVPNQYSTAPGMKNANTGNPGQNNATLVGNVNYVTGQFNVTFPVAPASGTDITLWVSQYQTGRPYSILFWNNVLMIRPVPKLVHKVEIEVYLTPVQFMQTTDSPILNQWWQLIAYGSSIKILQDRGDDMAAATLMTEYDRQEDLALERQATEEINQRNTTIFCGTIQGNQNWGNSQGWV